MPDILIVSSNQINTAQIEALAQKFSFRVKTAVDHQGALEWLKSWNFDLLCIESGPSYSDQEALADALWQINPLAPFVVIEFSKQLRGNQFEERLFGAEHLAAKDIPGKLEALLAEIKPRSAMQFDQFPVMVVEDLDSPRDIICSYVEHLGFKRVTGVRSAKEALQKLMNDPASVSCVLTDIKMPEVSGVQLIEQIRRNPNSTNLPIIVLTAYGSADTLIECLKAGASGFLIKPPKREDITRELGRAYRIMMRKLSPRLASPDEAEQLRTILEAKGFV